ncbi:MAG TPA: NADH-ubiquinone oxidoreductase-F iron-sulfur binding region domain-containing protein [Sporichthyaceae bacterium]
MTEQAHDLTAYRAVGGYAGGADLRAEVAAAGLRGRGGAWFPVELKWLATSDGAGAPVIVANGAEDEPGSRKDRHLMAAQPHLVIDGALASAAAVGADTVRLYVNTHAAPALAAIRSALHEVLDAGLAKGVDITVVEAPASYVAGEDSAAIEFLENGTAQPRTKPPYPAVAGLHGRPTVVSNVETLAHVALIARDGAAAFQDTMLITLPAECRNPGVYEVPLGAYLDEVIAEHGGGFVNGPARGVQVGGPASGWLAGDQLHVPLDPDSIKAAGSTLGCGALRVLPVGHCAVDAITSTSEFFAREQCGKCPPCRMVTQFIHGVSKALLAGKAAVAQLDTAPTLLAQVRPNTACALPTFALPPMTSAREVFADDFATHLAGEECGLVHRRQSLRIEDSPGPAEGDQR